MMRLITLILAAATSQVGFAEQRCDTRDLPLSLPSERFIEHDDGTVTDTASGLMWMRCSLGQQWTTGGCQGEPMRYEWDALEDAAQQINASGDFFFNDWRVPQLRNLAMLIERQCQDPRTNLEVFSGTPADFFWTSTLRPGNESTDSAYALSFGPDGVQRHEKTMKHHLRLVRTAQ
jgi:hypothetical protein